MSAGGPTARPTPPIAHRAIAVALIVVIVGAAVASLFAPLFEALTERSQAANRLARFETALSEPAPELRQYAPDELAAIRRDDGEAQIALQSILDRRFREAGVSIRAVRPLRAEDIGQAGRTVWVEVNLSGDLQALVELLSAMDAARPTLLVRRLEVGRDAPDVGSALSIRMEAGQAWRAGAGD